MSTIPIRADTVAKSGIVLMARVVGADGTPITQATIAEIGYRVKDITAGVNGVAGAINVGGAVFDVMQTGPAWTADGTGFNFSVLLPASDFSFDPDDDLPAPHDYQVDVRFTPVSGQPFVVPWRLWAWPVFMDE